MGALPLRSCHWLRRLREAPPPPRDWLHTSLPLLFAVCGNTPARVGSQRERLRLVASHLSESGVKLTRFWHLVPHLLTTLIWFPLKTWLLDLIFNSIFSAFFLSGNTIRVSPGFYISSSLCCKELLDSDSLSLRVYLMYPVHSRPVTGYILLATYKLDGTL